ncbi:MAG: TauD/TfdA dioxygenase family protein [Lautropia sp.]
MASDPADFTIRPSGGSLGADIQDIDLGRPLSDRAIRRLKDAWYQHLVLRFRGQSLDDHQLVAFTRQLGTIDAAPKRSATTRFDTPESDYVLTISNVLENGQPIGELGNAEAYWHQDMTYHPQPPVGAILYALEIPPAGGDTSFCDLYGVHDALPASLRTRIESLSCIHDISLDSSGRPRKGYAATTDPRQAQGPTHPLVRHHPRSGRKHLYLGRRPFAYIPGLSLDDSEALLDELWANANQSPHRWTQTWEVGDLILWDNRCTMHRRDAFDPSSRRVMHRTQLAED